MPATETKPTLGSGRKWTSLRHKCRTCSTHWRWGHSSGPQCTQHSGGPGAWRQISHQEGHLGAVLNRCVPAGSTTVWTSSCQLPIQASHSHTMARQGYHAITEVICTLTWNFRFKLKMVYWLTSFRVFPQRGNLSNKWEVCLPWARSQQHTVPHPHNVTLLVAHGSIACPVQLQLIILKK